MIPEGTIRIIITMAEHLELINRFPSSAVIFTGDVILTVSGAEVVGETRIKAKAGI